MAWEAGGDQTSFPLLQRRVTAGRRLGQETRLHPAHLVVFDLLQDTDVEMLPLPLHDRRDRLEQLLAGGPVELPVCPQTLDRDQAWQWYREWRHVGVEGLAIKDLAGRYRPARADWFKLKRWASTEAVVGGVTGTLHRPETLLLGRFDEQARLRYVGRTRRLSASHRAELSAVLPLAAWYGPQQDHPWPQPLPAAWSGQFDQPQPTAYLPVEPAIVVEISADVARDRGRWRHPVRLIRLRADVNPSDTAHYGSTA